DLAKLVAVHDLDKRCGSAAAADHIDRRRMLQSDPLAQGIIGLDLGLQFALGVWSKGNRYFVLVPELLNILLQVVTRDLRLVLVDEAAKVVAQLFRFGVEIAGPNSSVERPGMLGQRKIV